MKNSGVYVGGVIGSIEGVQFFRCYNQGNVTSLVETIENSRVGVGGASGCLWVGEAKDCYSVGNVTAENTDYIGSISGYVNSSATYSNLYYNSNSTINAFGNLSDSEGMRKTDAEMKSTTFVNLLNTNTAGAFKQDTNNINKGYPILSWQ